MKDVIIYASYLLGNAGFCYLAHQVAKIVVVTFVCKNPKLSDVKVLAITQMMR